MKKLMFIAAFLAGCAQAPKVVDGMSLSLGAYIPWDGQMYGVELINFVNGTVIKTPTNMCYEIQRKHSSTNDWMWGMLKTVESTETTATLK